MHRRLQDQQKNELLALEDSQTACSHFMAEFAENGLIMHLKKFTGRNSLNSDSLRQGCEYGTSSAQHASANAISVNKGYSILKLNSRSK